jgi:autotransporter-associated beta strand protein
MKNKIFFLLMSLLLPSIPLLATAYTWSGGSLWNSHNNWVPTGFPNSPSDTATFQGSHYERNENDLSVDTTIILNQLLVQPDIEVSGMTELNLNAGYAGTFSFNQGTSSALQADAQQPGVGQLPFDLNLNLPIVLGSGGSGLLSITCLAPTQLIFNGVISGEGGITIPTSSNGPITINQPCAYLGGTILEGGLLTISSSGLLPNLGDVSINGGTLTINSSDKTIIRNLTGTGGSLALNIPSGQRVSLAPFTLAQYQGLITGLSSPASFLEVRGPGIQIFSGINEFQGTLEINNGTLQIYSQRNLGTRPITLGGGTLHVARTSTISNTITVQSGTISAAEGTTTTLSGPFIGSGNLIIGTASPSGTVILGGTVNKANTVSVASGATLAGTGKITATTTIHGTLAPGNSLGILTNEGKFIQETGSTYVATPIPAPEAPETTYTYPYTNSLDITGDLEIKTGATFRIKMESFYYPNSYEVIHCSGNLTGSFDTISQGNPFIVGTLSYDANRVLLHLSYGELLGASLSWNAQQVAKAFTTVFFSGSSAIDKIFGDLVPLSLDQRDYALDQMHPATLKAMPLVQENNAIAVSSALNQRFQTLLNSRQALPMNGRAKQKKVEPLNPAPIVSPLSEPAAELNADLPVEISDEYAAPDGQVTIELISSPSGNFESANTSLALNDDSEQRNQNPQNNPEKKEIRSETYQVSQPIFTDSMAEEIQKTPIELEEQPSLVASVPIQEVETKVSSKLNKKPFTIWVGGLGDFIHQSNIKFFGSPQVGYRVNTGGLVVGADYFFCNHYYIGALGAYTQSDLKWNGPQGQGNIEGGYAGLYLSTIGQLFYGNLSLIGSWSDYHASRNILFPGVNATAKNLHQGKQIISHIDTGLNFDFMSATIRPFDSFDVIAQQENAFTETGAGIYDLSVSKNQEIMIRNEFGAHLTISRSINEIKASIDTKFSWVSEMRTSGKESATTFVVVDMPFTSIGYFPNRNLFSCGASFSVVALKDRVTYTAYYNGVFGANYSDNGFGGQLNFSF